MKKNLLVVVDMVNGFTSFGALADTRIQAIIPNIERAVKIAKSKGYMMVAFKDCHQMGDEEFKTFPPHCLKGTAEAELVPELKKYEKDFFVIEKNTTNGFNTYAFKKLITSFIFDNVYVVGCCTDICVKDFSLSLKNFLNKNQIKTNVTVLSDMVSTFDSPTHSAYDATKETFEQLKGAGITVRESTLNNQCQK